MTSLPPTPSRFAVPQRFCQSELECRHAHSLWVAAVALFQRYRLRLVFLLQGRKSLSSCRIDWGFDSVTKGAECADHSRSVRSL